MTRLAGGTVTASSDQSGFEVAKLFNGFTAGSVSDRWATAGGVTAATVRRDLLSAAIVKWYWISPGDGGSTQDPKDWTFEGSVDGATGWTVLDTRTGQTFASSRATRTFRFANTNAYRYYRLNISANNGSSVVSIGEWDVGSWEPTSRGFSSAQTGLSGGGGNYTLGTLNILRHDCICRGVRIRSNGGTAAFTVRVYDSSMTILASATSNVDVPSGAWYTVPLTTPLWLAAGVYMPAWRVTDSFGTHSATLPFTDGEVTIPASGQVSFAGSTTHSRYVDGDGFPVNFTGNTYAVTLEVERAPVREKAEGNPGIWLSNAAVNEVVSQAAGLADLGVNDPASLVDLGDARNLTINSGPNAELVVEIVDGEAGLLFSGTLSEAAGDGDIKLPDGIDWMVRDDLRDAGLIGGYGACIPRLLE